MLSDMPKPPPTVILLDCPTYDVAHLKGLFLSGLQTLGLSPKGRTLIKPNLVAAGPLFPHAHTRPEVAEGLILALQHLADETVTEIAVGERCGITVPSRAAFAESGFDEVIKRTGAKRYLFDEVPQVQIPYTHKDRLRDFVFTPEPVAQADFFINLPKFKAHPWTTVTFCLKNYIGIQDDRHRLIDHDQRLNEKIADLQHIVQPQFCAIDAIVAGEGRMLTPKPFALKLLILSNDQLALDAVCCHIIGLAPRSVEHLRLAEERGFGTTDLSQIQILGDVSLQEAQGRATGFQVGLARIEKYFEGSRITAYAGPPPDPEHSDYCWGGCPGAMQEAIEVLRLYDAECDAKLPRLHFVFGAYRGEIPAKPGEKVVFIGDCADWEGDLAGKPVQIRSVYKDGRAANPLEASHDDIFAKMASVSLKVLCQSGKTHITLRGCPVSVAEQVLAVVALSDVKNPYLDPQHAIPFQKNYVAWRAHQVFCRVRGIPYQKAGPCQRGQAAPK